MNTRFKIGDPASLVNKESNIKLDGVISSVHQKEDDVVEYSIRLIDPGWQNLEISGLKSINLVGQDGKTGGDFIPVHDPDSLKISDEANDPTLPDLEILRIAMERLGFKRNGSIYELSQPAGWFTAWMEHDQTMLKWDGNKEQWRDDLCGGPTAKHIIDAVKNAMEEYRHKTI